jgi:hypothetical protein
MNPYTINPPESEVVFEKLCLEPLKRRWARPGLERFAKKGEDQFGVDMFDTLGEGPQYAAQCKLKEQWKSLEPAEIRDEVKKAKTFPSKLDHYAILTTGKISGAAQLAIQAINQEHKAVGLFTVELFTWEKITELIRQYPEVEQQFYGGLRSEEVATVNAFLQGLPFKRKQLPCCNGIHRQTCQLRRPRHRGIAARGQIFCSGKHNLIGRHPGVLQTL